MKKLLISLNVLLATSCLAACQLSQGSAPAANQNQSAVVDQDDQVIKAKILVNFGEKTIEKEVTFEADDSVMDVLEDHFEIEESDGMVTSIEGVSQDPAKNTYWMYKVNDQMAEVGAESYFLKEGDKVEFYLETF